MPFPPIAIIGRGCVAPGALDPAGLWDVVRERRVCLTPVPEGLWPVPPSAVLHSGGETVVDRTNNLVGGYVTGFEEVFDPGGYTLPEAEVRRLDPVFQWSFHAAGAALRSSGATVPAERAGLVLGSLASPTSGLRDYAWHVWADARPGPVRDRLRRLRGGDRPDARNRFSQGLPALLTAQALGLEGGAFALDAACASSPHAVKLACDRLHAGSADLMLAGAVCAVDDMLAHLASTAVGVQSPTGRSLPLDRTADGLVCAQGAGFVALMRLPDALTAGLPVLGVIRGIGLTNDGRGCGPAAPGQRAQERAMELAWVSAGLNPATASLLECHATGTRVGDRTEALSTARHFADCADLPVGSLKANIGHAFTAAGSLGLLKLLGALEHGLRPAATGVQKPIDEVAGTPLRLPAEPEEWAGERRAALSTFGFGSNNAHLIIDGWDPGRPDAVPAVPGPQQSLGDTAGPAQDAAPRPQVAVVALALRAGDAGTPEVITSLLTGRPSPGPCQQLQVGAESGLAEAQPHQLLLLQTAREAIESTTLPTDRTQVYTAVGCEPEATRTMARWWAEHVLPETGAAPDPDRFGPPLTAAAALDSLGAMPARHLNDQYDLRGPGLSVAAEEASGLVALDLAAAAVRQGGCDAAVVAAAALGHDLVHQAALTELGRGAPPADIAVALVLKRLDLAEQDGDTVLALVDKPGQAADSQSLRVFPGAGLEADAYDPVAVLGSGHTADGLLAVAAAVVALYHGAWPSARGPATPWLTPRSAQVTVRPPAGPTRHTGLHAYRLAAAPWVAALPPIPRVFSGATGQDALAALDAGRESREGPARLVLLTDGPDDHARQAAGARRWLTQGGPQPRGVYFHERPLTGDTLFAYPNGATCHPGMGSELMLAFPHLTRLVADRGGPAIDMALWPWATGDRPRQVSGVASQFAAASFLSTVHTAVVRTVCGIEPDAVLGYSSGEASAHVAMDVWQDFAAVLADGEASQLYRTALTGPLEAVRAVWRRTGVQGEGWSTYIVGAAPELIAELLRDHPTVHLIGNNSPTCTTVAGESGACGEFVRGLDCEYALPLSYDVAVHTPELRDIAEEWGALHGWPTNPDARTPCYSCSTTEPYLPTRENIVASSIALPVSVVDFRGTVERAWRDGVRIFIENGPRESCTAWTREILAGREHTAIALDPTDGHGVRRLAELVAELIAAGRNVNETALYKHLRAATSPRAPEYRGFTVTAHPELPEVELPQMMERAPGLPPVTETTGATLCGASFDRLQPERHATYHTHELLGPDLATPNGRPRRPRTPHPPMPLADRVTGIDGEPAATGTEAIRTETQVTRDRWYLDPAGRMSPGATAGAGWAELPLISQLGISPWDRGERVYRLLGCDLAYHGGLPRPGETLRYEFDLDDHAEHAGIPLFFFHYDGYVGDELRVSVRGGQAGLFTAAELADSAGLRRDPAQDLSVPDGAPFALPPAACGRRAFDAAALRAFAEGRPADCFGPDWDITRSHLRTPRIPDGQGLLIDEITEFDPQGGPAGRGYLCAVLRMSPDAWFFDGHLQNDPCLPGTLMLDGGFQAMAFHLSALGLTRQHDGWRFEPAMDERRTLRCRDQATVESRELTYELFVTELRTGPEPLLRADLLCTVDGRKAFHAAAVALKLVPDWPLDDWQNRPAAELRGEPAFALAAPGELRDLPTDPRAAVVDGFALDRAAMLAAAWGRYAKALGPRFAALDGPVRTAARLPGAPYDFMTRILALDVTAGAVRPGAWAEAEYDIPADAWFREPGAVPLRLPMAALMEIALQPCGWLAQYSGCSQGADRTLLFRNLDGDVSVLRPERMSQAARVRTRATLRDTAVNGGMTLVFFDVSCVADDDTEPFFCCTTSFGYFPEAAFEAQSGLPPTEDEELWLTRESAHRSELTDRPAEFFSGPAHLPDSPLLMLDRVTGCWPDGGGQGLGRLRAEKAVDAGDWFFKAHFFQDPVQPGSLGVDAMYQLLRYHAIASGFADGVDQPRFEPMAGQTPLTWKYRGQVVPANELVTIEVEITAVGEDPQGRHIEARGWLWVDGTRIYRVDGLALRVTAAGSTVEIPVESAAV